ncbi:MAG: nuclear transport factor 2 family protein [Gammaproteobacteria bacterium]|nr:nuclear transport factor 2 family protein [Gammaproteobacteria bacterium]MBT8150447.1 nuclear transport factor 2 family protein [Gammaproteobacteria bacterium]NND38629.1 nuclear transport factor 2 family protein [Pseudomonadales bacterium]NNM11317.1 nuclear transport factor 2 family protein [Pseudomonadales bacterium]RZV56169.1 MAG: nuclear transport factor 2 family protein [Pseudomonadales bacterium]
MTLSLEQRITALEDELAVRNVVASYGMAVDAGDNDTAVACHTPEARYVVSSPTSGRDINTIDNDAQALPTNDLQMQGREAIAAMLDSPLHQSMLPNCAHTVGPVHVAVQGDSAVVKGYSRLYLREGDDFRLLRVAVNRWELIKVGENWLIDCRESRLVGEPEAQVLLSSPMP